MLAECPEHPLRDGNVVDLGGNRLEHRRLEEQVGILPVHPVNLGPGRGNPCIVLEIRLLIPLIQGTADKLGTDVEQHALVVLRSVNTVGRGFSVGQEFGLGNSPRKVVVQHLFGHHAVRKPVVARIGHGIGPLGDFGPLAFVPLLFAPRSRKGEDGGK